MHKKLKKLIKIHTCVKYTWKNFIKDVVNYMYADYGEKYTTNNAQKLIK